jgi:hypothetical protein
MLLSPSAAQVHAATVPSDVVTTFSSFRVEIVLKMSKKMRIIVVVAEDESLFPLYSRASAESEISQSDGW